MDIFLISPFENIFTKRGNRFPKFADIINKNFNYNVFYLTTNFSHGEKKYIEYDKFKKYTDYRLRVFKNIGYAGNVSISRILSHLDFSIKIFLYLLKSSPKSVILIPSRPSELIFFVVLVSVIKRNKVILDVTDIWPEAYPFENIIKKIIRLYCNIFNYFSIGKIDYFTYSTDSYLKWIKKYNKNSKTKKIMLGFDNEKWENSKPIKKIESKKEIIYIGQLTENIDIKPLVKALKKNNSYKLYLLCDVNKDIKNMSGDNVIFLSFLAEKEFIEKVNNAHISVVPMLGLQGGIFPNKAFDSIGSYKPILVFGNNDLGDYVKKMNIGWNVDFDEKETSNLLNNMTNEDIIIKSSNISKIRDEYKKSELLKRIITVIDEIVKKL